MTTTIALAGGSYLPRSISDTFTDAASIAAWLEAHGHPVRATTEAMSYHRALTWSGFHVYRNGWVAQIGDPVAPGMDGVADQVVRLRDGFYAIVDGKLHGTWDDKATAEVGLLVEQRRAAARRAAKTLGEG